MGLISQLGAGAPNSDSPRLQLNLLRLDRGRGTVRCRRFFLSFPRSALLDPLSISNHQLLAARAREVVTKSAKRCQKVPKSAMPPDRERRRSCRPAHQHLEIAAPYWRVSRAEKLKFGGFWWPPVASGGLRRRWSHPDPGMPRQSLIWPELLEEN